MVAEDSGPAAIGPGEGLLASIAGRRGQPHLPCFTGCTAEAGFSAVALAAAVVLAIGDWVDMFKIVSDDDLEGDRKGD